MATGAIPPRPTCRSPTLAVPGRRPRGALRRRAPAWSAARCATAARSCSASRGGLDAYLERGKTFGIPLLYPWANRLGGWSYEAAGRTVELDRDSPLLHADEHGLPIHGALAAALRLATVRRGADERRRVARAELDWAAHAALLAVFPFAAPGSSSRSRLDRDALRIETHGSPRPATRPCRSLRLPSVPRAARRAARALGGRAAGADAPAARRPRAADGRATPHAGRALRPRRPHLRRPVRRSTPAGALRRRATAAARRRDVRARATRTRRSSPRPTRRHLLRADDRAGRRAAHA